MLTRTKTSLLAMVLLVLFSSTAVAHHEAVVGNSVLHGIEHLLLDQVFLLALLVVGLLAAFGHRRHPSTRARRPESTRDKH